MKEDINEIKDFGTRDTGMNVPDNYFEDFTTKMNALIDEEEVNAPIIKIEEKNDKNSIFVKLKPFVYMAAMYIALFVFFKAFIKETPSDLSLSNAESYTETQTLIEDAMYASISDYDLMEYLYVNAN